MNLKSDEKTARYLERLHYVMQLSGYFSELSDLDGVRFSYADTFTDVWYNQAYDLAPGNNESNEHLIDLVESYFKTKSRESCIYTTQFVDDLLRPDLGSRDYVPFEVEAWMTCGVKSTSKVDKSESTVRAVKDDFQDFSYVYRAGLPGDEVEAYLDAAVRGHKNAPGNADIEYLVAYRSNEPVGMLGLVMIPPIAGVYAVATVPNWRNKGVARDLFLKASEIAETANCSQFMLQTVSGEASEQVFRKLGFHTLFNRTGYVRSAVADQLSHG